MTKESIYTEFFHDNESKIKEQSKNANMPAIGPDSFIKQRLVMTLVLFCPRLSLFSRGSSKHNMFLVCFSVICKKLGINEERKERYQLEFAKEWVDQRVHIYQILPWLWLKDERRKQIAKMPANWTWISSSKD